MIVCFLQEVEVPFLIFTRTKNFKILQGIFTKKEELLHLFVLELWPY
jgi:hypothetical protein